ncbi:hypothetical protein AB395_00005473 (plasmid) [Sinorhizobium fredii CCBAU 45436]|nr:hypothetical protein AB395_00005473 [Sinorhizobium fredii CCBAU 45436]
MIALFVSMPLPAFTCISQRSNGTRLVVCEFLPALQRRASHLTRKKSL